ncbi:hypothetical protein TKK_0004580 [Trichogramma kaykai]
MLQAAASAAPVVRCSVDDYYNVDNDDDLSYEDRRRRSSGRSHCKRPRIKSSCGNEVNASRRQATTTTTKTTAATSGVTKNVDNGSSSNVGSSAAMQKARMMFHLNIPARLREAIYNPCNIIPKTSSEDEEEEKKTSPPPPTRHRRA